VALVAGVAAALGELTGYLLGYGGRELLPSNRWEHSAERWMQRHGFLSITLFAFIPNPAFDAAGVAAGALRYAVWRFAAACFIGKTAKFILVAVFGAQLWDWAFGPLRFAATALFGTVGMGSPF
jgi:membrane protein YqaA with SNARE-associated domain